MQGARSSRDTKTETVPDGRRGAVVVEPPSGDVPERVGVYRILEKLGEGGMGSVYLAEQTEPVKRQVALKISRSPFADSEGRFRFAAERQAMARLQHPNVAQMFEASATAEGNPYFVMEHVEGDQITSFCDRKRLSIEQRLELFRDVCAGVQHAHQKGIMHRDLKPSNILVTEIAGRPVAKIIDFGIAKALDQPLAEGPQMTGDRLIGTPAYLSPEAARVGDNGPDVDTRSDVYSLGVVLYELLVGRRPFEGENTNMFQVLQRIAAEEPAEPSKLWSQLDVTTRGTMAEQRHIDPRTLRSSLSGDLDWIVLKAIAKDRRDRYDSVAELSIDIARHLRHEPVAAGPPSMVYRMKKFVRRRLGVVVSAALVVLALAAGLVARTIEARRANREASAAIEARQQTEVALGKAEQARAEADEVTRFLVGLFTVSDPGEAKGSTVTARELLDAGAENVRLALADQPLARGRVMQTIADVYRKLGLYDSAERLFEEVLEIRREHLTEGHIDLAETLNGLAALGAQLGRFDQAAPLFEEALAIRESRLGTDHIEVAMSLNNLASLYVELGRMDQAESLFARCVAIVENHDGPPLPDLLVAYNNLATLYTETQRYDQAEPLLRSFLDYQRKAHGSLHLYVAFALENLAEVRGHLGAYDEAESLYSEALSILEQVLDPGHPEVAYGLSSLASLYAGQGRRAEAEPLYRRALAIQTAALPEDHPERRATVEGLEELLSAAIRR